MGSEDVVGSAGALHQALDVFRGRQYFNVLARGMDLVNGVRHDIGFVRDIFPVRPVLDIEPPLDTAIAVNCFCPSGFAGEDVSGWDDRPLSLLRIGSQVRVSQQVQLARKNLARLREHAEVLLVEPVPYREVRGTGFYQQFLDTEQWPRFMLAGRSATLAALREKRPQRSRPSGQPRPSPPSRRGRRHDGGGVSSRSRTSRRPRGWPPH